MNSIMKDCLYMGLLRMTDSAHVENALFLSIDVHKCVDLIVVESSDLAGSEAQSDGGQCQILGYVARIEVDIPKGSLFVLPF